MLHILSNKTSILIVVAVAAVAVVVLPLFLSVFTTKPNQKEISFSRSQQASMATERFGVKIESNPPESKLTEFGVTTWPKYATLKLKHLPLLLFFCLNSELLLLFTAFSVFFSPSPSFFFLYP